MARIAFLKAPVGGILGLEMLTFVEPLGLICVAGGLEEAGHACRIHDLRLDGEERGLADCRSFDPDVVGLQCNFTTERRRALRLARLVVTHIIATGGVAMTDDLLGQFLGQDVLRRLSRRLGEGAFNGALTARLGVAAVDVTRPLPFLDAEPLRVREIFSELFKSLRGADKDKTDKA